MRRTALVFLFAAGCATLPHATLRDVERARGHYPDASLASLEEGRALYEGKCGSCHTLHPPSTHTPEQWAKAIEEMGDRAKLSPNEKTLLLQFLATMSVN